MRSFIIPALFLAACGNDIHLVADDEPEVITNTVTITNTVEVPGTDTDDLCDLEYEGQIVGALPLVTIPGWTDVTITQGRQYTATNINIESRDNCGPLDIYGVAIEIERLDGEPFPFEIGSGGSITKLTADDPEQFWEAPTGWTGNATGLPTSDTVWAIWDVFGGDQDSGHFDLITITNETLAFSVVQPVWADLPVGEYKITHTVHSMDLETYTEIWWTENLDDAIVYLTIE